MNYNDTIKYLNSFINYENKGGYAYKASFKLERIKEFLDLIENPQKKLKFIHVAGTKGKGSTCAFIAYILRENGFKTGLYTSPHLSDIRERIRILNANSHELHANGRELSKQNNSRKLAFDSRIFALKNSFLSDFEGMISQKEITTLVEKLKPVIDKFNKVSEFGPLSFFEVYTAIAFEYFKNKKIDFVVLETGLGGRLDATNIVNALVSCITPISLEHTQLLGTTLKEIAAEKAGIIKSNKEKGKSKNPIVISAAQEKVVEEVIKKRSKLCKAKLFVLGKDFSFKVIESDNKKQIFNYSGLFNKLRNLEIGLLGRHQLTNASTAIACVEALKLKKIKIPEKAIRAGLGKTIWPARFEIIKNEPKIILDAAHNPASAKALKETWGCLANSHKPILVFGISNDKDIKGVVKELQGISNKIILTKADNPRAASPLDLKKFFPKNKNLIASQNTREAMSLAVKSADRNDTILVTGSLFVVAEIRELCLN